MPDIDKMRQEAGLAAHEKTMFALVADAVRKKFEPNGFRVYVNTNLQKIFVIDMTGQLHGPRRTTIGIEIAETVETTENVYRTKSGKILTDADIQKLADEAEQE